VVVDARKEKFNNESAWELIHGAKTIITAKGKKVISWNPGTDDKTTILKHVIGPSGNLRAPALRIKDKFIIGFNSELYADFAG
jgi:hypothetical protein